jgi:hypothetical protein
MKKGKRTKHHHHRVSALIVQYAHLNAEQKEEAMEADVAAIASMLDQAQAIRVMEKLIVKFRVHR